MLNLYTETAFEAKPPTPDSRVEIRVPRANGSYDKSKFSTKDKKKVADEKSYAAEFHASASSIYFRNTKVYPRTFLWRIVSNERVLEVQCADFAKSGSERKEASLTLAIEFQDQISPRGVVFADEDDTALIHAFVLTRTNEVFELQLHTEFFKDPSAISKDSQTWCIPIAASSLSIDTAHLIYATSPSSVFVSFASGRVQHWSRSEKEIQWSYVNYDERTWGSSFLSIVGRRGHPDVDFEGIRLAYITAHALCASETHLYTLCLNHTLRVWDLVSGKLVDSRDLLDVARDLQERLQLNPSEPGLIRLIQLPGSQQHILATYSPLQGGQFKFWKVDADDQNFSLADMSPSTTLNPPDPDPTGNTIWSLTGLEIVFDKATNGWRMWLLWRNHNHHQAYTLHFTFPALEDAWNEGWVQVKPESRKARVPEFVVSDQQDASSKWIEYLCYPGRYSTDLLNVALNRYQDLTDAKLSSSQKSKPVVERMCLLVSSTVSLRKYEDSEPDFDRFAIDVDQQWRNFWRIIENMNDARTAPLSLAYDTYTDMTWIVMAHLVSAVREGSDYELLQDNPPDEIEQLHNIAREMWPHRKISPDMETGSNLSCLLQATRKFVNAFSPELVDALNQALEEDLYLEAEVATPVRLINIFNQVDLANAVSTEVEAEFEKDLAQIGGLNGVSSALMEATLKLITSGKHKPARTDLVKTVFGSNLIFDVVLDEVLAMRQLLFDLIIVTLLVDESENFAAARIFDDLVTKLKVEERNLWLGTHIRRITPSSDVTRGEPHNSDNVRVVSILEDIYGSSLRAPPTANHPFMHLLTTYARENLDFISGENWLSQDDASVHLQCNLIKNKELEYASDFLRFQPQTPLSTYIKGRLFLALGQYTEASLYFRRASYNLAQGKAIGQLQEVTDGLLSVLDANCFNHGLPKYFQHVMGLFDIDKAFSQTADFARLALQAMPLSSEKSVLQLKQELLSRLFTAELQCLRYEAAYESLIEFQDPALQKSCLISLITAMVGPDSSLANGPALLKSLQKLPWSAHPHLANHLDEYLALQAKKQTVLPGVSSSWLIGSAVDYLSIVHALRLSKEDYRGAVSVLFDRLRIVQRSGRARHDHQAVSLRHALLALINAMTCVAPDEAYILADAEEDPRITGVKRSRVLEYEQGEDGPARKRKRVIITLDDLRREYQKVLDRCSRIERGDFDFETVDDNSDEEDESTNFESRLSHLNGSRISTGSGDAMEF